MNELFDYYEIRILLIRNVFLPTHSYHHPHLFEAVLDVLLSHFRSIELNVNIYIYRSIIQ